MGALLIRVVSPFPVLTLVPRQVDREGGCWLQTASSNDDRSCRGFRHRSSLQTNRRPNMHAGFIALLTAALLAPDSVFCYPSSAPSFIRPFTDCIQSRGKGGFYRGAIDVTESGARCMNWTEVDGFTERHPGKGIGEHSRCRNPDGRIRPWCFFRNHKGRVDWGYCDCKQGKHAGPLPQATPVVSVL